MLYRILAGAIVASATTFASIFTFAEADVQVGQKDNGLSSAEEVYLERYATAQEKFGSAAVGANIVDDGKGRYAPYDVPDDLVASKTAVLTAMLNPPPTPESGTDAAPTAATDQGIATATPASGGYSIPADIVACESGGSYTAVNPSSGAGGAYQILPSTWAAYGGSAAGPAAASPAEQDAIAAEIYADSGGAAWVC